MSSSTPASPAGRGRFRVRSRIRSRLPWFLIKLGVAAQPASDCGHHEWYKESDGVYLCYHCQVGYRTTAPWGD